MKILMICGTYPPNSCGIGDYLYHIAQELEKDVVGLFMVNKFNKNFDDENFIDKR